MNVVIPMELVTGIQQPSPDQEEVDNKVAVLKATVEKYLPEFAYSVKRICHNAKIAKRKGDRRKLPTIALHQDSFAGGYHYDEYTLLGCAVKYAGLYGITVLFAGRNRDTYE